MKLILASGSPRRKNILEQLGFEFEVDVPGVSEETEPEWSGEEKARRLAERKAAAVSKRRHGYLVLASDTLVCLDGEILEKPTDEKDALRMLKKLSAKVHLVHTGLSLWQDGQALESLCQTTQVRFRRIGRKEMDSYIATGEPLDKAGAYGIQDRGARFVEWIEGCFFNVAGLPAVATVKLLDRYG